ncbi:MAG: desulfoferrodoxin family protein [Clostridia bacterium]
MSNQKFFRCKHCGNFVGLINNAGVPMICCGEPMEEIIPNVNETAAKEKHLPVVTVDKNLVSVKVGEVIHPSTEEHHIEFIYLETKKGGQRKEIAIGEEPVVTFSVIDDTPLEVFAYCNLHGLWKTTI